METKYNFATKYKELREDFNKKQGDIAEILKVKTNTYSKWENLINDMPFEKANELANYYHTTLDYLLGLSNNHKQISQPLFIDWNIVATRLAELRKRNNLSQQILSEKLGFPQTTYSQYETGKRKPTTLKILIIALYYNISIDYIAGRSEQFKII